MVTEVCNVEKRRTSAYHSQGNGFAERNIRSIRDILRAVLLDRNISQKNWRVLLPEVVFSLNVTESKSIKCVPYEVVFGRSVVLPQDILFGIEGKIPLRDVNTAAQYAQDVKLGLQNTHYHVTRHLHISRDKMQRQYNKNIRFYNYKVGDKVWVKMKYYKVGENRKLSPRRSGPWTIREKLPNGLNFKVTNDSSKSEKIIHHDRLSPAKAMPSSQRNYISEDGVLDSTADEEDLSTDDSEESDNESTADGNQSPRYPKRIRVPRRLEGAIPWEAVEL